MISYRNYTPIKKFNDKKCEHYNPFLQIHSYVNIKWKKMNKIQKLNHKKKEIFICSIVSGVSNGSVNSI